MFGLPMITCVLRMLLFLFFFRKDSIKKYKVNIYFKNNNKKGSTYKILSSF